ncbi:MAG: long-chain fatty acid--CoA ligase [Nitrososphaerota archaeon]|nr:long-chain fatty acid--CoA ligase [Nitrososphaerota archaeon]
MNFSQIFRWHAQRTPTKIAINFEDQEITYRELDGAASRFANSLRRAGGNPCDIAAILLYNRPEFLLTAIAANRAGLTFLPLNYRLAREEWAFILADSSAKFIVTESIFKNEIDLIRDRLPYLQKCILVDGQPDLNWQNFSEFVREEIVKFSDYDPKPDELHRLMYTSGTTANPKGVMISYSNMWWKTLAHAIELESKRSDIALVAGPLYHVGAFDLAASHVLLAGGSLVMLRKFDAKKCLDAISKHRVTVTWLAPSMLSTLLHLEDVSSYDLSSVRLIIDGGEKMPEPLISKLLSVFPNAWYADAYGLTETVSGDTFVPKECMREKLGSVGLPTLFVEIKIVDEDDKEVPHECEGEILIRGPKVFKGYWKNEMATSGALRDGWFHTADIGRLDKDGFLYITDRKKDMIKSGGENISSLEIERVLYLHPDIIEAAVVGMKDSKWGELPVAFVVTKGGKHLSEQQLSEFCLNKIAKFKIPNKFIAYSKPLPRNPSGKVLKRLLREELESQATGATLAK